MKPVACSFTKRFSPLTSPMPSRMKMHTIVTFRTTIRLFTHALSVMPR